jgi:hypothetical protein
MIEVGPAAALHLPEQHACRRKGTVKTRRAGGQAAGGEEVAELHGVVRPDRMTFRGRPRRWYDSEEYRALKALRLRTARGSVS